MTVFKLLENECFLLFSRSIIPDAEKANQDQHLYVQFRLVQNAPDFDIVPSIKLVMDSSDRKETNFFYSLMMQSTDSREILSICLDSFMHLSKSGSVL